MNKFIFILLIICIKNVFNFLKYEILIFRSINDVK